MRYFASTLTFLLILTFGTAALAQRANEGETTGSSESGGSFLQNIFSGGTTTKVTSGQSTPDINAVQMEAYNGPKARIAVAQFKDKTGKGWWTGSIGDGMADQLATSLFNSNRYIVLERQLLNEILQEQDLGASGRVRTDTAAPIGEIEGAELLITGAVTEFEGNSGGTQGGLGGLLGGSVGTIIGAISGGYRKAHIAIDIRIIDTRTSRIVAATSVEGEATDVNLGGALRGAVTGGALGGSLAGWKNTPIEKALRICIRKAVEFLVSKTPQVYYRHGTAQTVAAVQQPAAAAPRSPVYAKGALVRVTSKRINMRAGPSTSNAVVTALYQGTPLLVEEQSGDWIRVKTEGGDSGWVAAWLTFEDAKLSPEAFAPAPSAPAAQVPATSPAPAPSTATAAASPPSQDDLFAKLKQLKRLHDAELITDEEYAAKKQQILDQL